MICMQELKRINISTIKEEFDFQIVEYDKFPELVNLWNIWQHTTCFYPPAIAKISNGMI